jgi:hypothetical protein
MTKNSTSSTNSKWTGMVPVDDTALAVTDTGGPGIPVVYLNGQFATQPYWRHRGALGQPESRPCLGRGVQEVAALDRAGR